MYREAMLEVESKLNGSNLSYKTKSYKAACIASISDGNPSMSLSNSKISLVVKSELFFFVVVSSVS
jgi:hypothetical protein